MFADKNIALSLEENAVRRGFHPAIIDRARVISYRDLNPLVQKVAGHLSSLGLGEGDIIGVCLQDSADHLMINYAIARIGGVILPLDWRWTEAEKINVMTFFGATMVAVEPGAAIENFNCVEIDTGWQTVVEAAEPFAECASGGDRPVVLSLSSGTTGRPKGPMMTHAQFTARFVMQWVTLGFNQHDRYLSATPIYFGGGRSFTMGCLFSGSTVVMFPPPYSPEELIAAVKQHQATTLLLVPTLLRKLLELPAEDMPLLGGLNQLLSTGAILHSEERDQVMVQLNPNFINYYGSTEGGGTSVLLPKHRGEAASSVGEPIYQTDIQIVDGAGSQMPVGEAGHIRYRSPGVSDSYYNDPEASKEAFLDGWFYPGDIGKLDEEGLLYLVGRAKDVIIRNGINVYPGEVEQVLLNHAAIQDAVAVAWPHAERGEDVAVFVILGETVSEEELLAYCRENLASYKMPKGVFFIDELPKTALGKVVKADLVSQLGPNE